MLWLKTLSSFGSSFIGHGLPRGCNGVVSTLCLRRYGQVGDSGFSLGLGWDLHWLERGRNRVVDLHCWGPRSRANKQIKSFVRDWIRAGREGQSCCPKDVAWKGTCCFCCCGLGRSEEWCVCVWVCEGERSGLARRALTADDCAPVCKQACRCVDLQCATLQRRRARGGRKRASVVIILLLLLLRESISGVVRQLGSKKAGAQVRCGRARKHATMHCRLVCIGCCAVHTKTQMRAGWYY